MISLPLVKAIVRKLKSPREVTMFL